MNLCFIVYCVAYKTPASNRTTGDGYKGFGNSIQNIQAPIRRLLPPQFDHFSVRPDNFISKIEQEFDEIENTDTIDFSNTARKKTAKQMIQPDIMQSKTPSVRKIKHGITISPLHSPLHLESENLCNEKFKVYEDKNGANPKEGNNSGLHVEQKSVPKTRGTARRNIVKSSIPVPKASSARITRSSRK